jgi:hypothetical protein
MGLESSTVTLAVAAGDVEHEATRSAPAPIIVRERSPQSAIGYNSMWYGAWYGTAERSKNTLWNKWLPP